MKKYISSRNAMLVVTRDYLAQNSAVTASVPQFSTLYPLFTAGVAQVQTYREQMAADRTGVAENKAALRLDLQQKTADIGARVRAYAQMATNQVLEAEVNFTDSKLSRMSHMGFRDLAQLVYTRANSNLTALATYGVTSATLATLKTAIDAYTAALPKPAMARKERKTNLEQLQVALTDLAVVVRKMDAVVELMRYTQPVFYKGYREARRIDAPSSTHHAVRAKVLDAATGLELKGVRCSFVAVTEQAKTAKTSLASVQQPLLSKRTAKKGGFYVSSLPEGDYLLTVSKYGYTTQQMSISVNSTESTLLSVELEKNAEASELAS